MFVMCIKVSGGVELTSLSRTSRVHRVRVALNPGPVYLHLHSWAAASARRMSRSIMQFQTNASGFWHFVGRRNGVQEDVSGSRGSDSAYVTVDGDNKIIEMVLIYRTRTYLNYASADGSQERRLRAIVRGFELLVQEAE